MRDYFPLPVVLDGVFKLIKNQFNIDFSPVTDVKDDMGSVWHPDTSLYKVTDQDDGQVLGHCYLDPYIRYRLIF